MKRSGPPARRTPLKPGKASLARSKPLQAKAPNPGAGKALGRSKGLKPMSDRRRTEAPKRRSVREAVLERDGSCRGPAFGAPGRCWHPAGEPLDVHEIVRRSRWREGYLDPDNCLALCRAHHDWVTANDGPDGEARRLGLSSPNRPGPRLQ